MVENQGNKGTLGGDPLSSEVYRIYRLELEQHIERLQLMAKEDFLVPDCVLEARTRFHTIRGGAGFFGFSQLVEIAGQMEKKAAQNQLTLEDLKQALEQFKIIVKGLPSLKVG